MPVLKKACCCANLQIGTIVIGWLGSIQMVWSLITTLLEWALERQSFHTFSILQVGLLIVFGAIQFFLHLCLIIGGQTNSRKHLVPWLAVIPIEVLLLNVAYSYLLVIGAPWGPFVVQIVFGTGLAVYLWLIVFSYYQELKDSQNINRRDVNIDI